MSIESATYIADLQSTNPPSSDPRSQGDDHLRLIKAVLQNQFPGGSRAWPIPTILQKSANYNIVSGDQNAILLYDTSGGSINLNLPSLAIGDAGWSISFMKTNVGANPAFINPPSGTLSSGQYGTLAKARRAIPGIMFRAFWSGTIWYVSRCTAMPVGTCLEYHESGLPAGYEYPNGQTLGTSASYPEYWSVNALGGTTDKRGRIGVALDNLGGSAAGRLGAVIPGTSLFASGGSEVVSLSASNIPTITSAGSNSISVTGPSGHTGLYDATLSSRPAGGGAQPTLDNLWAQANSLVFVGTNSIAVTSTNTGGGSGHSNLQPSIIISNILVVE